MSAKFIVLHFKRNSTIRCVKITKDCGSESFSVYVGINNVHDIVSRERIPVTFKRHGDEIAVARVLGVVYRMGIATLPPAELHDSSEISLSNPYFCACTWSPFKIGVYAATLSQQTHETKYKHINAMPINVCTTHLIATGPDHLSAKVYLQYNAAEIVGVVHNQRGLLIRTFTVAYPYEVQLLNNPPECFVWKNAHGNHITTIAQMLWRELVVAL